MLLINKREKDNLQFWCFLEGNRFESLCFLPSFSFISFLFSSVCYYYNYYISRNFLVFFLLYIISGQTRCIKKVNVQVATTVLNLKDNHQSTQSANVIAEKQPCKDSCRGVNADNQTVGQAETLKHMVYQHCLSSSVSGHNLWHMKCFISCCFILNCGWQSRWHGFLGLSYGWQGSFCYFVKY